MNPLEAVFKKLDEAKNLYPQYSGGHLYQAIAELAKVVGDQHKRLKELECKVVIDHGEGV